MKYLIIILFFLAGTSLKAQSLEKQVIGSAGSTSTAGGFVLSATVGELAVETKTGSFALTEGYHQAFVAESVAIKNISIDVDYSLYPNPSSDFIIITLDISENISGKMKIINTLGKIVVENENFAGTEIENKFDISHLTNGVYFLNIAFENKETKQISFIKK